MVPGSPVPAPIGAPIDPNLGMEIDLPMSSNTLEDGSMEITIGEEAVAADTVEFNANLAEYLDDGELGVLASELITAFDADEQSRKDWVETYKKGLDLLGLKFDDRTMPWAGASGVYHPILSEAAVRFQANAIMEIFPAAGPVRTKIVGQVTHEREEQAARVEDEMNYTLTERMVEYRPETEKLLFTLSLAGAAFRKVHFDPMLGRPVARFVPPEDFVISYGATDLLTAERYTHIMRKTSNEVRKLQVAGFYRDIDVPQPALTTSTIEDKKNKLTGQTQSTIVDDRYQLLEMHVDLDLPGQFADENGIALPYVVTLDKQSQVILAIRRNWLEDDDLQRKRLHFVQYEYVPGLGFYGFGLIHLIGGLAKAATSLTRQLIDAGTLSILPSGYKTRGLRIKGDSTPLIPGEFRDVDIASGQLKDNIFPLPFKEPSAVVIGLLGNLVDEARAFASLSDTDVGDTNKNTPVGTTLALLERAMKVMSAVQARIHASLKNEFKLIAGIIRDNMDEEYDYDTGEDPGIKKTDFDDRIDIIPVSDPNASSMTQRMLQYQAALEMARGAPPGTFDQPMLYRKILNVIGIRDGEDIVPLPDDQKPMDPVAENMALLTNKPVKAFLYQEHEAHIAVHMAAIQDPKIKEMVGQSPTAGAIVAAAAAHIQEHVAFQYRREIEKQMGVELPDPDQPLPEDVEYQLSKVVADAAGRLLQKDVAEAKLKEAAQKAEDPVIQMQMQELQIKVKDLERKAEKDRNDYEVNMARVLASIQVAQGRNDAQLQLDGARLGVEAVQNAQRMTKEEEDRDRREQVEGVRIGVQAQQGKEQLKVERERIASQERSMERNRKKTD